MAQNYTKEAIGASCRKGKTQSDQSHNTMVHPLRPTLLVNEEKVKANIRKMRMKALENKAFFRPHFKTHQSGEIGEWFRQQGVEAITVSSVSMAKYFAFHGWKDITIAFPVNLHEINEINRLLTHTKLNLLLEDAETATRLSKQLASETDIFIKIDCGAHRTGIPVKETEKVKRLANHLHQLPKLQCKGLLTHAGHLYQAGSHEKLLEMTSEAANNMLSLKRVLGNDLIISWGDTPSCAVVPELHGFEEWRPGNFVFYDLMQQQLGSCSINEIAVAMVCPVVAVHPDRMILHGGAVHFSKESLIIGNKKPVYGKVFYFNENGIGDAIDGAHFTSLSQEHGIVEFDQNNKISCKVNDLVAVLPVHSCLTASCMREYHTLSGHRIEAMHKP